MQLTALTLLAAATGSVSAAVLTPKDASTTYTLTAQSENQVIYGGVISASGTQLWVSLPQDLQDANCGQEVLQDGAAIVFLQEGPEELFLYGGQDKGNLVYIDNLNYTSSNAEVLSGWSIDPDAKLLFFSGSNFLACPGPEESNGAYTVDILLRSANLEVHTDCFEINILPTLKDNPVACRYTEEE
ncbi:uncharacterized protein C8A04DRAFT_29880 [Dichotomopilus funicola]|uniref:Uncharacterized protein n=1 Tax=Dichotomopilus funicola TaxID=1934379 RepID=A0AAN6ZM93_9PEZI|nr:hypothetical protein C8A04DRAFT_29880 [Dichotomopilus funicola]